MSDHFARDHAWAGQRGRPPPARPVRVYDLQTQLVRPSTTNANSYADVADEAGLTVRSVHSKDRDEPQRSRWPSPRWPRGSRDHASSGNFVFCRMTRCYMPEPRKVQQAFGQGGKTLVATAKPRR